VVKEVTHCEPTNIGDHVQNLVAWATWRICAPMM